MTAGFGREEVDQRPVEKTSDHWDDEDDEGAEEWKVGIAEVTEVAGVRVPAEELGEALDQVAEADRAEAGTDPDGEGEGDQQGFPPAEACAQFGKPLAEGTRERDMGVFPLDSPTLGNGLGHSPPKPLLVGRFVRDMTMDMRAA